jgi:hypothetical protein
MKEQQVGGREEIYEAREDKKILFLSFLFLFFCSSCVSTPYQRLNPGVPIQLELSDITFIPPQGPDWFLESKTQDQISFFKDTPKGRDHTIIAFVLVQHLESSLQSFDDLKTYVEQETNLDLQNLRFKNQKINIDKRRVLGQNAAIANFIMEDHQVPRAPGKIFLMKGQSIFVVHPHFHNLLIHIGYSQRVCPGENFSDIENELRPFWESFQLKKTM